LRETGVAPAITGDGPAGAERRRGRVVVDHEPRVPSELTKVNFRSFITEVCVIIAPH
jgi:hypothetical protein